MARSIPLLDVADEQARDPPANVEVSVWKGSVGLMMMIPLLGWVEIASTNNCRLVVKHNGTLIYNRSQSSGFDLTVMTAYVQGHPPSSGKLVLYEPLNGEMNDEVAPVLRPELLGIKLWRRDV